MAFNTLEYLETGNVDFVFRLSQYDIKSLIRHVKQSDRRIEIINGFLSKLKDDKPYFCFEIIYDIKEFKEVAKYILDRYYRVDYFTKDFFELFLNESLLSLEYLTNNFESILNYFQTDLDFIFRFLFNNIDICINLLKKASIHDDLHIRYLFMKYLITNCYDLVPLLYDDITKYLTSETYKENEQLTFLKDYMAIKDVCDLAFILLEKDYQLYLKFKKFILENYQYNLLAYRLLQLKREQISEHSFHCVENVLGIEEFNKDADTYFSTSNYRVTILDYYSTKVSKNLLEAYRRELSYFYKNGEVDDIYSKLAFCGLDRKLPQLVDKYLSLSSKKTYEYINGGSTASCYRIGDYAFKLIRTKYSYENVICPDLYLIIPNLEEEYIRSDEGYVLAGIEVQKFLNRKASNLPPDIQSKFIEELKRLGYYTTDTLVHGNCGDNCMLLDSYIDSGNLNPPDWFKEYPMVLIDRDRIYNIENKNPKQLSSGY